VNERANLMTSFVFALFVSDSTFLCFSIIHYTEGG